ncbi:NAD-dependent epimerase/dehydratase family protein [Amycolatopsis sp. H20-H5]|uniref:NAD-dependent epimerase/dehydratase family protein n=1 Tax=Amycolatopsis sp. H20-H5 TaxID=3046309 RepID=UPI002DBD2A83|nr:NAD(P)-dependent oxidoreductase [Amycolatopsis sp. H20-H5]MEC3976334.1 NAD(P)-dependent oxidoreductase [Amycolatopsis sp. H20-H5]
MGSKPLGDKPLGSKQQRRRVFLTGASGNWGRSVLTEFAERAGRFDVVALVLPTAHDREAIRAFQGMDNLTVVHGDLTDYAVVENCVRDADFVLHVGAVVSPYADDHPELTHRVNVGSARNIIRAVAAQPDPASIGVVMVGSVAQTGDRNPPHHWGRIGDPLRVARFDEYGQSKIVAERALVDSGLPKWAWLRQTGIFHPGLLGVRDPIMTHCPFEGTMEWVSVEDSARLLANLCEPEVPPEFWCGVYNIGGGEDWRLTNWELQTRLAAALGVTDIRRWHERDWFATRNFHGQWYTDSDRLAELVPFRRDTFDAALNRAVAAAPATVRLAGKVPAWIVKNLVMKPLTRRPRGTLRFLADDDTDRIDAYFGSRAEWASIGDWTTFVPPSPDRNPRYLDHGYDEPAAWSRADYLQAARFRGGELLSDNPEPGDITTPLHWRCAFGHTFLGSPRLVLTAGHWCPDCVRDPAGYRAQAERNPFLAQLEDR